MVLFVVGRSPLAESYLVGSARPTLFSVVAAALVRFSNYFPFVWFILLLGVFSIGKYFILAWLLCANILASFYLLAL